MNYPQEVKYMDLMGKYHKEVYYCETGQAAMKLCRQAHEYVIVVGAGRIFNNVSAS